VWITPYAFVCSRLVYNTGDYRRVLQLGGDSDAKVLVHVTPGTAAASAAATCDIFLPLVATNDKMDVCIGGIFNEVPPISGAGISIFFQESRKCLRQVKLTCMALNEDLCLALATSVTT
jgi:hypothetical protein